MVATLISNRRKRVMSTSERFFILGNHVLQNERNQYIRIELYSVLSIEDESEVHQQLSTTPHFNNLMLETII